MLQRWSPNTAMLSFASIGVSGGWSTYPHAGCPASTRKYSSSRWYPYRLMVATSSAATPSATAPTGFHATRVTGAAYVLPGRDPFAWLAGAAYAGESPLRRASRRTGPAIWRVSTIAASHRATVLAAVARTGSQQVTPALRSRILSTVDSAVPAVDAVGRGYPRVAAHSPAAAALVWSAASWADSLASSFVVCAAS